MSQTIRRRVSLFAIVVAALMLAMPLVGCDGVGRVDPATYRQTIAQLETQLAKADEAIVSVEKLQEVSTIADANIAQAEIILSQMEDDAPGRAELKAGVAKAKELKAQAQAWIADTAPQVQTIRGNLQDALIAARGAVNDVGEIDLTSISQAVTIAGAATPIAPYTALAGLGLGLIGAIVAAFRNKRQLAKTKQVATDIVASFDAAQDRGGELEAAMRTLQPFLAQTQSDAAQAFVTQAKAAAKIEKLQVGT